MNNGTFVEIYLCYPNMSDVSQNVKKEYIALKRYFL